MLLAEPGPPSTAAELLQRLRTRYPFDGLELSLQTTRDDLRLLSECGFPVVPLDAAGNDIDLTEFENLTGKLKGTRWSLRDPSRLGELYCEGLPRPSCADVIALDLLRSSLGQCAPAGFWLAPKVRQLLDEVARLQGGGSPRRSQHFRSFRVSLRFRAVAAAEGARVLPSVHSVSETGDGEVLVEFDARSEVEAERLALSLADCAIVEDPPEMRRRVAERLQLAYRNYDVGAPAAPIKKGD